MKMNENIIISLKQRWQKIILVIWWISTKNSLKPKKLSKETKICRKKQILGNEVIWVLTKITKKTKKYIWC